MAWVYRSFRDQKTNKQTKSDNSKEPKLNPLMFMSKEPVPAKAQKDKYLLKPT